MKVLLKKNYYGFEDILDGFRDVEECIETLPGEFQGTIKITVEYLEEGEDDDGE